MIAPRLVTHDGVMHGDEVMATAILKLIHPESRVLRTRDQKEIDRGDIIYDVGGIYDPYRLLFDHHMKDGPKRENGIPYSSAGLIWKHYGENLVNPAKQAWVEKHVIEPVCMVDNGAKVQPPEGHPMYDYVEGVNAMNPTWIDTPNFDSDAHFNRAVTYTTEMLRALIKSPMLTILSQGSVPDAVNQKFLKEQTSDMVAEFMPHIKTKEDAVKLAQNKVNAFIASQKPSPVLELDKNYPWAELIDPAEHPHLKYVVFPAKDDWRIQSMPAEKGSFQLKCPLPEAWRGKKQDELTKVVPSMIFCHASGFIAGAKDKQDVMKLAKIALEVNKEKSVGTDMSI